ncbi:TATA-binding protein-associated factor BTAF1 [Tanacetum coccineum]
MCCIKLYQHAHDVDSDDWNREVERDYGIARRLLKVAREVHTSLSTRQEIIKEAKHHKGPWNEDGRLEVDGEDGEMTGRQHFVEDGRWRRWKMEKMEGREMMKLCSVMVLVLICHQIISLVFMKHDWNPMRDLQAMDRAHRLGQRKVVNVHRLIMRGTLKEKVMSLQKFKVSVANAVINSENASLKTITPINYLIYLLQQILKRETIGSLTSTMSSMTGECCTKLVLDCDGCSNV